MSNIDQEEKTGEVIMSPALVSQATAEIVRPVIMAMSKLLENNTAALEEISAAINASNARVEALEKQIRLQTPVTAKQVTYMNEAIRHRSRLLLFKKGVEDKQAVNKLYRIIKKTLLSRHGVGNIREIPKCEYDVDMSFIETWNDVLVVHDVVKAAKEKPDEN